MITREQIREAIELLKAASSYTDNSYAVERCVAQAIEELKRNEPVQKP